MMKSLEGSDPKPSIFVKKLGGIGSVVLATPMLRLLKTVYPGAHLAVMVESGAPAEILSGNPAIDEIIALPAGLRRSGGLLRYVGTMLDFALRLRRRRFDIVINGYTGFAGDSLPSAVFTFLAGGRCSVGYARGPWGRLYTRSLRAEGNAHEVERNLALARLVRERDVPIEPRPEVWLSDEDHEAAESILRKWGISDAALIVGMHPGSGGLRFKRWHPAGFAELADRLVGELDAAVVLVGGAEDREAAAMITAGTGRNVFDAVGMTSLKHTAALIARCRAFVSNDTGLMHIAAALDVPVAAIFGPTDPERTGPFGPHHIVVRSRERCSPCYRGRQARCDHLRCMGAISVDDVVEAVGQLTVPGKSLSA
jgi:lipopolysaccharide heptosyltransferase II